MGWPVQEMWAALHAECTQLVAVEEEEVEAIQTRRL